MFSSITSYLFGSSEEEPTNQETVQAPEAVESTNQETGLQGSTNQEEERLHTQPAEDEWVLVEKSRGSRKRFRSWSSQNDSSETDQSPANSPLPPNTNPPHVLPSSDTKTSDLNTSYHSNHSGCHSDSDMSSVTELCHPSMHESWLVTPPACFTAGTASKMESSSMENLLIEHPSMSVYSHRGRQGSAGADSDNSESSTDEVLIQSRSSRAGLARHEPPRRPNALAARVGLNQVQGIKSMQRAQQRHMYRNLSKSHIVRSNKVNQINGRKRRNTQLHVQQPQKRCISIKQC